MVPWWSQRAQVTMVKLGGWITQLSHPRSDRQNDRFDHALLCFCICKLRWMHTNAAACLWWRPPRPRGNTSGLCCCHPPGTQRNHRPELEGEGQRSMCLSWFVQDMWSLWVVVACGVLRVTRDVTKGCSPLLPDKVQPTGRQLGLTFQVEFLQEALPDGLQRVTLTPEDHTAFKLFKRCENWPENYPQNTKYPCWTSVITSMKSVHCLSWQGLGKHQQNMAWVPIQIFSSTAQRLFRYAITSVAWQMLSDVYF